jgi:hypothetical protein
MHNYDEKYDGQVVVNGEPKGGGDIILKLKGTFG